MVPPLASGKRKGREREREITRSPELKGKPVTLIYLQQKKRGMKLFSLGDVKLPGSNKRGKSDVMTAH